VSRPTLSYGLTQLCHNFLDFESSSTPTEQRLSLLHSTIEQALLRRRRPSEWQELEYAHQDCHRIMADLGRSDLRAPDVAGDHRFRRLARVAGHYESFLERVNRRYWWVFCLLGLAMVAALMCGSLSHDWICIEPAATTLLP